jgi:hypothetical protein
MRNPGDYSLCDLAITTALNAVAQTPVQSLEGMFAASIEARLAYGSGGTTCKAYVQTTHDDGITWDDVACFAFTTASATKKVNLSGLTPVTSLVTPSDGAMADNTVQDGCFGSAMRVKLVTTGTYANTVLRARGEIIESELPVRGIPTVTRGV